MENVLSKRIAKYYDELKWLYMELYDNESMFAELMQQMEMYYNQRGADLKKLDMEREAKPDWYKENDLLGMMLYIDNFADNIQGVKKHLSYLQKANINYVHLMPFLDTTEGKSDGGYAVKDFRKVKPELGTMDDLKNFTKACHKKKMCVCMDFVMNHTSEDHEWAVKARQGDGEYMSRYFFYDNDAIPNEYEKRVPQVFPTTAPGNFTWIPEIRHYVLTSFYPYQWDLNYRNPRVFNEMMYNFLYLTNQGIDIMRLDAVPYIWKELGTNCRNLPQIHTIVRMMRMILEIVCPGVILLGEVVMEPSKVVPYFGTIDKPECHMLYNVTTMATTWHTVATKDTRLLKQQLDIVNRLPKDYVFLNYLRCHDDIGWGLDFETLKQYGMEEVAHKNFLNAYFQGSVYGSTSRGELYNYDPVTQDARFCGTTASLCGIEKAGFEQNKEDMESAIRLDIMLHAYMFMQSGIPIIYSGDEIAQVNDYSYKNDENKKADSRNLHRGKMNWEGAKRVDDPSTVEGKVFSMLQKLEVIRRTYPVFSCKAQCFTLDLGDVSVLCMVRQLKNEKMIGVFNFSPVEKKVTIQEKDEFINILEDTPQDVCQITIPAYGFYYFYKVLSDKEKIK